MVRRLRDAASDLESSVQELSSAPVTGLGNAELENASNDLADDWSYGIGKLREASGTAGDQLEEGIRAYEQAESDLKAMLDEAGAAS